MSHFFTSGIGASASASVLPMAESLPINKVSSVFVSRIKKVNSEKCERELLEGDVQVET